MKNLYNLSLTIVFLFIAGRLSASHLMGGQITARNIGGLTYEITLTTYRDIMGIPMSDAQITYSDSATQNIFLMNTISVGLPQAVNNGVERYVFIDTVTFPAAGPFVISYSNCCRNAAILNLPTPSNNSMILPLNLYVMTNNSSPVFLNEPITLAQQNIPFYYNPLPYDIDGDSVAWALDVPQDDSIGTTIPIAGYTLPASDTSMPFSMDPLTGEISFLPNTLGNFVVSVIANEYRNGNWIGAIRRDMQIIVESSSNLPLIIAINSNCGPANARSYTITPGTAFHMTVNATNPEGNLPGLTANGSMFMLTNPAAVQFTASGYTSTATIDWTPTALQARSNPYLFTVRTADVSGSSVFYNDITISLRVGNFTGINQNMVENHASLYPNPATDYVNLKFTSEKMTNATISIFNVSGQILKSYKRQINSGENIIQLSEINLPKGHYLLKLDDQQQKPLQLPFAIY